MKQVDVSKQAQSLAFEVAARDRMIQTVLSNTATAWPDEPQLRFVGNSTQLSGLSDHALLSEVSRLQRYSLKVENQTEGSTLRVSTEEGQWTLGGFPHQLSLKYLGWNDIWFEDWPPPKATVTSMTDFENNTRNASLPRMITIVRNGDANDVLYAIAPKNSGVATVRMKDLANPSQP